MAEPHLAAERRERRIAGLESHLRVQYGMAIACVVVLAVTGLSQKFDSFWICRQFIEHAGGIETVQLVHRVTGGALILVGVYHLALVLVAALVLGEPGPLRMIPTPDDVRAAARAWASFLGFGSQPPPARGAHYLQKLDYWFWGWSMGVMALTGIINLVPFRVARWLSADLVLAALRTHSDAALIVVAWVLVVHVAYSGLAPSLFRDAAPADAERGPDPVESRLSSLRGADADPVATANATPAEYARVVDRGAGDGEAKR